MDDAWVHLCDVSQLVIVKTLDIVLLHECINVLLDIGDLWRESVADLVDDLFDEVDMLELLATLHNTNDHSLNILATIMGRWGC